jgi:Cu-Zn family superoxide dismutase
MGTTKRAVRVARGLCALGVGFSAITAMTVSAAGSATSVGSSGSLTRYDNPYANGTANPIEEGAEARVHAIEDASGRTIVTLHVSGLPANRPFGSHVHLLACGDNNAGGHYQNDPGTGHDHANAANEVWLDFETNAAGNATAKATVDWTFRANGANAVVIHDRHTTHGDPGAGTAGAKLACLDVDF